MTCVGDRGIAATPTALWHRLRWPVIDIKRSRFYETNTLANWSEDPADTFCEEVAHHDEIRRNINTALSSAFLAETFLFSLRCRNVSQRWSLARKHRPPSLSRCLVMISLKEEFDILGGMISRFLAESFV